MRIVVGLRHDNLIESSSSAKVKSGESSDRKFDQAGDDPLHYKSSGFKKGEDDGEH